MASIAPPQQPQPFLSFDIPKMKTDVKRDHNYEIPLDECEHTENILQHLKRLLFHSLSPFYRLL
jgi:hypothetical protein